MPGRSNVQGAETLKDYAGGQRIAEARPGEPLRYYVTDHLGSVRQVYVPEEGAASGTDYLPYGARQAQAGPEARWGFIRL